jgi:hypothetical protein
MGTFPHTTHHKSATAEHRTVIEERLRARAPPPTKRNFIALSPWLLLTTVVGAKQLTTNLPSAVVYAIETLATGCVNICEKGS